MTAIDFAPDGTARCLYTEAVDLRLLGRLRIERATGIEYDNASGLWQVLSLDGKVLHGDPSRDACLEWERLHLMP